MRELAYTVLRSSRKTVAIQILPEGQILVRCPRRFPAGQIDALVRGKRAWIEKQLARLASTEGQPPYSTEELARLRLDAARDLPERVARLAPRVGVTWGRVGIRAQHSRWGSCSAAGNLNFNCLLMLAPEPVRDYVVVHELCHRLHMDHSPAFWAQVERVLPDYRAQKAWLKAEGAGLIRRLPPKNGKNGA